MEFVPGEPITLAADRRHLTISQRLELFTQVCHAVQHAHQKAIIHRDLKPSNILVTESDDKLLVKVIDFGVAKAIDQHIGQQTLLTEAGQLVGTPEYMSPEQADRSFTGAADIDTRSDVYSLGVTLFELLAGAVPFELHKKVSSAGGTPIQQIIHQLQPPRPSNRFSSLGAGVDEVARRRRTSVSSLRRQLQSELEWIPLKAMRKERDRRYATAAELSQDIENYLARRPLLAGPESAAYRARKFLRRNARGVTVSAAILLLLVAGIVGTSWQAIRATRAQRQARTALAEVQQQKKETDDANQSLGAVNDFFTEGVIGASDPELTRGRPVTVLEALDKASASIQTSLPQNVKTKSAIEVAISSAYRALGEYDRAMPHARAAAELCARNFAPDDHPTMLAHAEIAWNLMDMGKLAEAEPIVLEQVELAKKRYGINDPRMFSMLAQNATLRYRQGRLADAEPLASAALAGFRRTSGDESIETVRTLNVMALIYRGEGKLDLAESMLRQANDLSRRVFGDDHPDTLVMMSTFGAVLQAQGKLDEALAVKRDALEKSRRVFGEEHPHTITFIQNYADLLAFLGKKEQAAELFAEALEKSQRILGPDDHATLAVVNNYARLLDGEGKFDQAEPLYRQAVDLGRKARGMGHPDVLISALNYARALSAHGRLKDAEGLDREALQAAQDKLGPDHRLTMTLMQDLAQVLARAGQTAEAEKLMRESLARRRAALGDSDAETVASLAGLVEFLLDQNRPADAEPIAAELYQRSASAKNIGPRFAAANMTHWGLCLARLSRYEQAEEPLREAHRRLRAAAVMNGKAMQDVLTALISVCQHRNETEDVAAFRAELAESQAATKPASSQPATLPAR
jgi:non-specific serine/threonine protein kinase/serine/threonine-protein kinase